MNYLNIKLQTIFDYCKEHLSNNKVIYIVNDIEKEVKEMTDTKKESFINDFKKTIKNRHNIEEGLSNTIKNMTLGALLATCLINPALAQTKINKIQTDHPVIAKYESGKKGYDCIAKDNYGGYSYGKYQISTERRDGKPSTFDYFMKYAKEKDPNIEYHLRKAGGWDAAHKGDKSFRDKWCEMSYRKDFQQVYDGFIRDNEFLPVYQKMDNASHKTFNKITDWASKNKAVQASIHSAIIQHGKNGAFKLMKAAIETNKINKPEDFIKAIYDIRIAKYPKYKSRYKSEFADVSKYLKNKEAKI